MPVSASPMASALMIRLAEFSSHTRAHPTSLPTQENASRSRRENEGEDYLRGGSPRCRSSCPGASASAAATPRTCCPEWARYSRTDSRGRWVRGVGSPTPLSFLIPRPLGVTGEGTSGYACTLGDSGVRRGVRCARCASGTTARTPPRLLGPGVRGVRGARKLLSADQPDAPPGLAAPLLAMSDR